MTTDDIRALLDPVIEERRSAAQAYLPGEHRFAVGRASGSYVFDEYGCPYLDFGPGGAVNILGHDHPQISHVITEHLRHYTYTGEDHLNRFSVEYARALSARFPEHEGRPRQVLVASSVADAWRVADTIAPQVHREIETGFGRTGVLWGFQRHDSVPDVVILGPSGGGGLPFAAVVAPAEALGRLSEPTPMSFHPLACAAATVVLSHIDDALLAHVRTMGELLADGLVTIAHQFPAVLDLPHGVGLLQNLVKQNQVEARKFREECRVKGLLMHPDLRLTPPLTVSEQEVGQAVDIIAEVCMDWS